MHSTGAGASIKCPLSALLPRTMANNPSGPRPDRAFRLLSPLLLAVAFASTPCIAAAAAPRSEAARIRVFETSLRPAVSVQGQPEQRWTLQERMERWKVPGLSIAVIRDGKIAWSKGYGVLQAGGKEPVTTETMFSVGSVSKVGAAAVTLRLVDAGKLDLDRDVNSYLTRWKVPDNSYTVVRPVTLRGVMSHSAGLSVHGFADYQPGETLPTTVDTLLGRAPAKNAKVEVIYMPGSRFQYSGGGTTVEQLVVEEVTGGDFPSAARRQVFEALGMKRSSYENPLPAAFGNIAKAHGRDGKPRALPRGYEAMPETAASGLWTTPSDYATMVIAFIQSYQGTGNFLSGRLARQMMTEVGRSVFGLGPRLEGEGLDRRFMHGGANDSYMAWMEGHLATGNGVVIFTNGSAGTELYTEARRAVALAEGWSDGLDYHQRMPAVTLTAAELSERAGVYAVDDAFVLTNFRHGSDDKEGYEIVQRDGALYRRDGNELTRLYPMDATHFVDEEGATTYQFLRDYAGEVNALLASRTLGSNTGKILIRAVKTGRGAVSN